MIIFILLMLFLQSGICDDAKKPNIVVILTDDQDVSLGGMNPMKNVQRFIGKEGVTFSNSFTTSPICCPSRASFLTGLYLHNHKTWNNSISGGCYGHQWKTLENETFATELSKAGYNTFYAGKYLNEYGAQSAGGPELVPAGWSEWHGLVGNSVYYNYTLSNNGVPTHSTDLYLTDIIRDLSINFIENQTEIQPFLMILAPPAPHQPFTPAQRHKGTFNNVTAVKHPNFNIAATDKHWLMKMPPSPLPDSIMPELDRVYRSRWESLLAVDEMVADVVDALETRELLDNTYLIYTSDNGYHVGQFSQVYDKRQPYESDIRIPLLIRGPGVPKDVKFTQPVLNIDISPTIFQLAGVTSSRALDGNPISLFNDKDRERKMLIEYYGEGKDGSVDPTCAWSYDSDNLAQCYPEYDCKCQDSRNNTFACVRHLAKRIDMKYCLFADKENFTEMYNLQDDPYELLNIADNAMPSLKHWYKLTLALMLTCKGAENCDNPLQEFKVLTE